MNKQIFKGQWDEVKGKIQQQWGELTDNELSKVKGDNQEIFGFLQKHYGFAKDEAQEKVNQFVRNLSHKMDGIDAEGYLWGNIKNLSSRGGQMVAEKVQERPLATVGIALAAGTILGWLCSRK